MTTATIDTVQVDGMTLAYRELGSGPPVLLLHGWPTSSFLWRAVMEPIARSNRVVALDLPGFGASDKPEDTGYTFERFERAIDGFLDALEIEATGLAVHDLGGPVGLHWALRRPERLTRLALLNTLVYPEFSDELIEFVGLLSRPETRDELTSPQGLAQLMRRGVADPARLPADAIAGAQEPFTTASSRNALAAAALGLDPAGFVAIAKALPTLDVPVRIVYGERDAFLPDVADTMARVKRDLPQAVVTPLPGVGHFLQEEAPDRVGELLAEFFAA